MKIWAFTISAACVAGIIWYIRNTCWKDHEDALIAAIMITFFLVVLCTLNYQMYK